MLSYSLTLLLSCSLALKNKALGRALKLQQITICISRLAAGLPRVSRETAGYPKLIIPIQSITLSPIATITAGESRKYLNFLPAVRVLSPE